VAEALFGLLARLDDRHLLAHGLLHQALLCAQQLMEPQLLPWTHVHGERTTMEDEVARGC
jgi:hypothetical protein